MRSTSFVTSIILISILLAGCGTPVEEHAPTAVPTDSSVPPEVPIPTDTPTPIPPTPTLGPLPGSVPEGIILSSKGKKCTVSGPTELPTGDVTFVLRDLSELDQTFYVGYFTMGYTFQDLIDLQGTPGRFWSPKPKWLIDAYMIEGGMWNDASRNEQYFTYSLDEEGEYVVYLGTHDPPRLWFCAPLQVKEAPSE